MLTMELLVVTVCVCLLAAVSATDLKHHHDKDGEHDDGYDHDAILGQFHGYLSPLCIYRTTSCHIGPFNILSGPTCPLQPLGLSAGQPSVLLPRIVSTWLCGTMAVFAFWDLR